ncbi:hypothetical protein, partial [Salmonella enterica]|uniref:hypothetical protein n=1 Tax=Salmonella enterica TaxID=28901 RepID=UPI0032978D70
DPVRPEEWAFARARIDLKPRGGEELLIEGFDGSRKIILNSAVPILGAGNVFLAAVVVNEDITDLKLAERSFREATERFEAVFR